MDFKILLERITPTLKAIARRHVLYGTYDPECISSDLFGHIQLI